MKCQGVELRIGRAVDIKFDAGGIKGVAAAGAGPRIVAIARMALRARIRADANVPEIERSLGGSGRVPRRAVVANKAKVKRGHVGPCLPGLGELLLPGRCRVKGIKGGEQTGRRTAV